MISIPGVKSFSVFFFFTMTTKRMFFSIVFHLLLLPLLIMSTVVVNAFSQQQQQQQKQKIGKLSPANNDLQEIYQSISEKAYSLVESWPESDSFLKCLDRHPQDGYHTTPYQVTKFPAGEGPVGVFALAVNNYSGEEESSTTRTVVNACLDMFDQFLEDLKPILIHGRNNDATPPPITPPPITSNTTTTTTTTTTDDDDISNEEEILIVKSKVPHISVAIFQENPRLLHHDDTTCSNQNNKFLPIDDGALSELARSLENQTRSFSPIHLKLHSVLLTPDGAMIAGFLDDSGTSFTRLKSSIVNEARDILKGKGTTMTSRPKNLIHMTCGRVAALVQNKNNSEAIQNLVREYNQKILPAKVSQLQAADTCIFRLVEVTLLRNDVWLCEKNTEYGSGRLLGLKE